LDNSLAGLFLVLNTNLPYDPAIPS
jgi:hypothetical protein